jgi:hypothetical protein
MDIYHYALNASINYLSRMNKIRKIAETHPDVLVLQYETMVLNAKLWVRRIPEFLDQPMTDKWLQKISTEADFSVSGEDAANHKRQMTPGDYKRKLKPETIKRPNEILGSALAGFEYQI